MQEDNNMKLIKLHAAKQIAQVFKKAMAKEAFMQIRKHA
jgi:hypothetical protein